MCTPRFACSVLLATFLRTPMFPILRTRHCAIIAQRLPLYCIPNGEVEPQMKHHLFSLTGTICFDITPIMGV